MQVLAGDIGGTNARLALVDVSAGGAKVLAKERVAVAEQEGIEGPLAAFLARHGGGRPPCCLGVAGTIIGRRAEVAGVNMPWGVDAAAVERSCGLPRVTLINDFHAAARGVELMTPADLHALGGGAARPGTPRAILGAGTGLGQALMVPLEGPRGAMAWRIVSSEGGHRDFGPRTPLQDRLLVALRAQFGRVSTERVLSGPGLVAIYRFLVAQEERPACAAVEAAAPAEVGRTISTLGVEQKDPTCQAALDLFLDVYGAEAGNVALTAVATGGIFIAGGIAPDVLTRPAPGAAFRRSFEDKGRFADLLRSIPVWVVTSPDLGLLGAAAEAVAHAA